VDSILGEGATFHIQLPIVESDAGLENGTAEIETSLSDTKHLLVVNNEPYIRDLLARSLGQLRYTVDLAEDGQEAWRKIQRRSYDCVIMDLQMPNMSGQELFGLIQGFKPDLARKSIFMTGDIVTPQTQAFVSSVSRPTLSKPFELEELREHIQMLLER
jgi:CheY-like chemotaxis protein